MKQRSKSAFLEDIRMIFRLLFQGRLSELLLLPTDSALVQFCRYCLVGGMATVVDWAALYVAERLGMHYLLAAVLGFLCGLVCNYTLSKLVVFSRETAKLDPRREFLAYGAIGIAGLVLTILLMYLMTEWLHFYFMISKVIATVMVLFWNFLARKYLLY